MSESPATDLAPGYDLHPAWRGENRRFEEDAVEFWTRLDLLPAGVGAEERARELAAVAYQDGRLVAVTTLQLGRLKQVRARLAMLRAATDPEHQRSNVARALAVFTFELIERWSAEHPQERVAGMGAIVQGENLRGLEKVPIWPSTRLVLIGHNANGQQIRLRWFAHARLDLD